MSDGIVVNGGGADVEKTANDNDSDETVNQTIQKLMQKLAIVEEEKQELVNHKELAAERMKELENEIEKSESDKRTISSIAARAAELETEVSRLQHDLISSMSEVEESNSELLELKKVVEELKKVVEELKKSESEKSAKLDVIEKERNLLLAKISEKDDKIQSLDKMVDEFQSLITKNRADLEKLGREKEDLETGKKDLEGLLEKSEKKVIVMKSEIHELKKELEAYLFKENAAEDKRFRPDWLVVAAATGALAMVAVVYFRHR